MGGGGGIRLSDGAGERGYAWRDGRTTMGDSSGAVSWQPGQTDSVAPSESGTACDAGNVHTVCESCVVQCESKQSKPKKIELRCSALQESR